MGDWVLNVDCFGVSVGLEIAGHGLLEAARSQLPPGWRYGAGSSPDHLYQIWGDPNSIRFSYEGVATVVALADRLSVETLADHLDLLVSTESPEFLFVHAGVVGWRGQALLIPGSSFAGKSTLVNALVGAGADYLSDEFAVLEPNGRVLPYSRPLKQRLSGGRVVRTLPTSQWGRRDSVTAPGSQNTAGSLEIGLVALLAYKEGAFLDYRRLSPGELVLELMKHTVAAQRRPALALNTLSGLCEGVPGITGWRGEAKECVEEIEGLLEHLPGEVPLREEHLPLESVSC